MSLVSATDRFYNELPSEDHIRLLELLPGPGRVECRMHFALLPDDKDTYEALSYTWDLNYYEYRENCETFPIWYNGLEINVTENLYTALCNRRDQSSPALLWVDALCINQEDLKERSHQVQRMGLIYENAFQVIVWFGKIYYEPRKPKMHPLGGNLGQLCRQRLRKKLFQEFARSLMNGEVELVFSIP